jgi:DNA segregation ATPase FtsK/SpoIIIE-like protein
MKHLDNIHPDRFYTELVDNAFLIHEVIEGETQSGELQTYYDFEDAEDEASYDGAKLSEILCDVLLIGKNRAERIFNQFERDGIVSPKDENGKRKIIN